MDNKKIALRKEPVVDEILSGPKLLYVKNVTKKIETYGFFLRFIHRQFEPCQDCQTKLLTLLKTKPLNLTVETMHISFHQTLYSEEGGGIYYEFGFPFLVATKQRWAPCPTCQKELQQLIDTTEQLHIGNSEFAEPVELWMKFAKDENGWKEVERRASTPDEQERLKKEHWA